MPMIRSEYPPDWEALVVQVKERAGQCCEQCGVPNYALVHVTDQARQLLRDAAGQGIGGPTYTHSRLMAVQQKPDRGKIIVVVLTVAHLDRDTTHNDLANLRCLCQYCHLNYDRPDNVEKTKYGRLYKADHQLKISLS